MNGQWRSHIRSRISIALQSHLRSGSLVGQSARLIIEGSWVQVPPGPCTPRRYRRGVCVNFPEGLPPLCPPRYVLGPSWKRFGTTGSVNGRVAQLVRALLSHSRGPGFESLRAHAIMAKHERPVISRSSAFCVYGCLVYGYPLWRYDAGGCRNRRESAGAVYVPINAGRAACVTVTLTPACRNRPMARSSSRARNTMRSSSWR